ncbi:hypothetical protein Moror_1157 [Moniliophthora roreri MCA 2997]|uniref:DUF6593 domain-containing protein n=2 Tax=Moniliophthora roreri TaxID=221103 RepID=V2XBF5_MONRO|nr:hypothetical protein Moror_1157 [Moniliophthora roreri MCA 2997]KAI3610127.1 hypothetical protein WG66_007399 [Moniliophthora roreri]
MGNLCSCLLPVERKGFFPNSSGFVINGGVFTVNQSSKSPQTPGRLQDTAQVQCESDVYARMLLPKRKGYPLWRPDVAASLPIEYQEKGVSIGDVGVITEEGGFQYFFNILLPADHPCNGAERVPPDFTPLNVNSSSEERPDQYGPGTHICNPESEISKQRLLHNEVDLESRREVENALGSGTLSREVSYGLRFIASGSEGAVLILPDGASQEDHLSEDAFDNYAARNAISWYNHINGRLGCRLGGNSLMVITGVDKATAWGVASFTGATPNTVFLEFTPDSRTCTSYWFRQASYAAAHAGPTRSSVAGQANARNQCIFVRGIRVSVQPRFLPSYGDRSASGLVVKTQKVQKLPARDILSRSSFIPFRFKRRLQSESTSQGELLAEEVTVTTTRIPAKRVPYHPSAVINEILLELYPEADLALTHDFHWFALLEDGEQTIPDELELRRRLNAKYCLAGLPPSEIIRNGVIRPEILTTLSQGVHRQGLSIQSDPIQRSSSSSMAHSARSSSLSPTSSIGFQMENVIEPSSGHQYDTDPSSPPRAPSPSTSVAVTAPEDVWFWTNQDPRESQLFNSRGILYRFQTTVNANGTSVTTMWRAIRSNKEDRVAKLEWAANGGLGRITIGKGALPMADLVRPDHSGCRTFNGPDGLKYRWRPARTSQDTCLLDPNDNILAFYRPTRRIRYLIGDVHGELHFVRSAGAGTVMHPPMMDMVTITAMLYRFCSMFNL